MANLTPASGFTADIYRIELNDAVQGGETGISNKQAKQLIGNDIYLKTTIESNKTTADADVIALANEVTARLAVEATLRSQLGLTGVYVFGSPSGGDVDLEGDYSGAFICDVGGMHLHIMLTPTIPFPKTIRDGGVNRMGKIEIVSTLGGSIAKPVGVELRYAGSLASGSLDPSSAAVINYPAGSRVLVFMSYPLTGSTGVYAVVHVSANI